jgi:rubrerythrin
LKANPETGKTLIEAIKHEIEGRAFYLALAEKVKNPLVRRKLLGLADDELEHRETLSRLYWAQTGTEVGDMSDFDPAPALPDMDDMTMEQLLDLAMKTEKEAADNYLKMAEESDDSRSSAFLEYLSEFEMGHYEILAAELARIKGTPGWEDEGLS